MNVQTFRTELIWRLTPIYGTSESEAIARVVLDHLERTLLISSDLASAWPPSAEEKAERILKELLSGKPLQYVLNEAWFDNALFYVDESVLIPRPETEELFDWVKKDQPKEIYPKKILEVGTGSGILCVSLKRLYPNAQVISIDISEAALLTAHKNANRFGLEIEFKQMDFMDRSQHNMLSNYDLVVSNPPYISFGEKISMLPHVLEHEPWTALFVPDEDPLCFYRAIADFGANHLNPGGKIYVEIHEDRSEATRELFESAGYRVDTRKDMQEKNRMIRATKST